MCDEGAVKNGILEAQGLKGWKTFVVSLALITPAGMASAANCKVPDNFDNIQFPVIRHLANRPVAIWADI
ncbi:Uncharacterised protein [BD1-7 clade bacterium]|uniref:Uncharacterized protein n=1 Tax=BD1-7 clade bacterium TaxID=2029982 RepID=A0A5S9QF55_9GAMM|nr:Uncharacterised protein [BD1-7 clade bacterium]CAA0116563.1 Uncharacterised protein [BD1-7 clade bacterium]CAA0120191.1 Uncharacterised protein [BD1-7 clade bacterium]